MSPQETTASSGANLIGATDLLAHRGDLAATLGKVALRPSPLGLRLYGGLETSTPNNIDCAKVGVLNPPLNKEEHPSRLIFSESHVAQNQRYLEHRPVCPLERMALTLAATPPMEEDVIASKAAMLLQPRVGFGPSFSLSRLDPAGPVSDP